MTHTFNTDVTIDLEALFDKMSPDKLRKVADSIISHASPQAINEAYNDCFGPKYNQ